MMMNDEHDIMKNNILGNDPSANIDNLVQLPLTAELLVVNNVSTDGLNENKLNLQCPALVNVGNNYIVASLKGSQGLSGKYVTLDSSKNATMVPIEPPAKKQKTDSDDAVKKMLISIQHSILERLVSIEKKVEKITSKCQCLEEKVESMILRSNTEGVGDITKQGRFGDLLSGVSDCAGDGSFYSPLLALNSEDSYPDGSWLGNPENEAFRVRSSITPKELVSLNETCTTPVKMALTLLDYLFDRETQACSNISGVGKHGKQQLDPVKIFGIRCHLMYIFGVTEPQWRRIKLNLDSKCRSAFRRKQKGMPLSVKGFREKPSCTFLLKNSCDDDSLVKNEDCVQTTNALSLLSDLGSQSSALIYSEQDSSGNSVDSLINPEDSTSIEISRIIHADQRDVHVIQATLEQLVQLKNTNQVEILTVSRTH